MLGRVGSSHEFTGLLLREQTSSLNHAQRRGGSDGEIQQQPHGADHSVGFLLPLHLRTVASSQKSAPVQPLASWSGAFLLNSIIALSSNLIVVLASYNLPIYQPVHDMLFYIQE